jgi:hypothetical protein
MMLLAETAAGKQSSTATRMEVDSLSATGNTFPTGKPLGETAPILACKLSRPKDLFLTQRFARHASPVTTVAFTHPPDEEL